MREEIRMVIIVMILMFLMVTIFTFVLQLSDYMVYKSYQEKGYVVRYNFWGYGCEMKIRNLDETTTWRGCSNAANPFVRENYAVMQKEVGR